MAISTATVTSLDGFHATPAAQRADKLARALFDAVNADAAATVNYFSQTAGHDAWAMIAAR
jgi:hypothetical protein